VRRPRENDDRVISMDCHPSCIHCGGAFTAQLDRAWAASLFLHFGFGMSVISVGHLERENAARAVSTGLLAIVFTLVFIWLKGLIDHTGVWYFGWQAIFLGCLLAAACFYKLGYQSFPSHFATLTRFTGIGLLLLLLLEPPFFTLANERAAKIATYVNVGFWIALATSLVGLLRPSFLYPTAFYLLATRYLIEPIGGFMSNLLDIRYLIDMAMFLACAAGGLSLFRILQDRFALLNARFGYPLLVSCLVFIAIGFHFGNYFWSGYEKLVVGPHPWTWVWENKTQDIMLGALKRGVLPSGGMPDLTQVLYDGLAATIILANVLTVCGQLAAIVAPLRMFWLRLSTWGFDVLHLAIYVWGGLLFWPWIWNNLSVLLAVRGKTDEEIGWAPKVCCVVAILMGGSSSFTNNARLAWFDVADFKIPMIQARVTGGEWVDVPPAFFYTHFKAMTHGYIDLSAEEGHYFPTLGGSANRYDRRQTSGTCPPAPRMDFTSDTVPERAFKMKLESPEERAARLDKLKRLLRAHHDKMLWMTQRFGRFIYYGRAYIHPSNPWLFEEFDRIDLTKIEAYRLVTQSVCLKMKNGRLEEREIKRSVHEFPI
jgi:hypothetical protein